MASGDEMPCHSYDDDYSALLDGELAPDREAELRSHVDGCARCRARLESLRGVDAELRSLPAPAVAHDLRERLQRRIDTERSAAPAPPGRAAPRHRRRWLRAPALAAAIAAAAAIALYLALAPERGPLPAGAPPGPPIAREPVPTPAPTPERIGPPEPPVRIAETPPEPAGVAPQPAIADLDAEPLEDVAVALELEVVEDLDVIANLELLEALVAMEEGTG